MWQYVLTFAPLLLSVCSLVVHFLVFHRLKCTKDLDACLKECLPDLVASYVKQSSSQVQSQTQTEFQSSCSMIDVDELASLRGIVDALDGDIDSVCDDVGEIEKRISLLEQYYGAFVGIDTRLRSIETFLEVPDSISFSDSLPSSHVKLVQSFGDLSDRLTVLERILLKAAGDNDGSEY